MLTPSRRQSGVTIIEILIAVALLALLVGMGVPTFRSWMQNSQIRTAADGILNGVQLARAEAIRRNKPVEFMLRDGANWAVLLPSDRDNPVQENKGSAGSQTAIYETSPAGADRITFNPMGAPASRNQDGSVPITSIDIDSSAQDVSALRPLRIVISLSGSVRMCDPDEKLSADDPRRCAS